MRRSVRALAAATTLLSALALAGCSSPKAPAPATAESTHARAQALIESGSAAFRSGDYAAAAKRFASAVEVSPEDAAAYYGLGMALAKLGRDDDARVAYAKARELSRGELDTEEMPHEVKYRRTRHP
jgi:Flp pilus assembly protein TadD